jgi:hypothetical protein
VGRCQAAIGPELAFSEIAAHPPEPPRFPDRVGHGIRIRLSEEPLERAPYVVELDLDQVEHDPLATTRTPDSLRHL